jgi:hypothetical protein
MKKSLNFIFFCLIFSSCIFVDDSSTQIKPVKVLDFKNDTLINTLLFVKDYNEKLFILLRNELQYEIVSCIPKGNQFQILERFVFPKNIFLNAFSVLSNDSVIAYSSKNQGFYFVNIKTNDHNFLPLPNFPVIDTTDIRCKLNKDKMFGIEPLINNVSSFQAIGQNLYFFLEPSLIASGSDDVVYKDIFCTPILASFSTFDMSYNLVKSYFPVEYGEKNIFPIYYFLSMASLPNSDSILISFPGTHSLNLIKLNKNQVLAMTEIDIIKKPKISAFDFEIPNDIEHAGITSPFYVKVIYNSKLKLPIRLYKSSLEIKDENGLYNQFQNAEYCVAFEFAGKVEYFSIGKGFDPRVFTAFENGFLIKKYENETNLFYYFDISDLLGL